MKSFVFLISLMVVVKLISAQGYMVSFGAIGLATDVDSVQIENVSQSKSISIMGDDILHLVNVVGIESYIRDDNSLCIYPNPSKESLNIEFWSDFDENGKISIYDISGKTIFIKNVDFKVGLNYFKLSGFSSGMYILNMSSSKTNHSQSFISSGDGNNMIDFKEDNPSSESNLLKSNFLKTKSTIQWQYNDGDILVFRAYANGHSRITVYHIVADVTLFFDFILCQDADGYKYPVTTIGSVTYMTENLSTAKYNNNSPIPEVTDNTEWGDLTTGGRCYFDNDSATYASVYGALYNFAAVNTGNLCPNGWHVPTYTEWQDLLIYLQNTGYNYTGFIDTDSDHTTNDFTAKSLSATSLWTSSDIAGTPGNTDYPDYRNRTGFCAIGAGLRNPSIGIVTNIERIGKYWSSTIISETHANGMSIQFETEGANIGNDTKTYGQSVRCVKD